MIENVTPLIITFNEAPNIRRTLERLNWAKRIVVIDSGSTDATLEILRDYPQVVVIYRPFDDFASQCNFGLQQVETPWVLSLDADYELSAELVLELSRLQADDATAGFSASFIYRIFGRSLRASLYPPRIVLYRKDRATYVNEGHGHRVVIAGEVRRLTEKIYHDDRKPLSVWLASQQRYAVQEVDFLLTHNRNDMRWADQLRLTGWIVPLSVPIYTLIIKGCGFDGWAGWYYALQRFLAETMIALEIIDRRLRRNTEISG